MAIDFVFMSRPWHHPLSSETTRLDRTWGAFLEHAGGGPEPLPRSSNWGHSGSCRKDPCQKKVPGEWL